MPAQPAGAPAATTDPSPTPSNLALPTETGPAAATHDPIAKTAKVRRLPQSLVALRTPHFRIYLIALVFGSLGLWVQRIALDWLVLQLTHSVSAVGMTVTLQFAPVLVLGLFGGALVDRFDPRKLLIASQSLLALMAAVLAVLVLTGTATVLACYALALGSGLAAVVEQPGRLELVNRLVGRGGLRSALGLNATAFQSAGIVGPLLAGALIHGVGLGWCFALNALTCLAVVVGCLFIRTPERTSADAPARRNRLSDGLRVVRRTPEIAWTIVLVAVVGVFGASLPVMLSAMSARVFSAGVSGYGLLTGMVAAGAVIGAQLAARNRRTLRLRELTGLTVGLGLMLMLSSAAPTLPVFAAMLIAFGIVQVLFLQSANTLIQLTAPEWVRGRVISVYVLVVIGGQAFGGLISGAAVDLWGPRGGILLNGAVITLLTALCALRMAYEAHLTLRVGVRRVPGIRIVTATRW